MGKVNEPDLIWQSTIKTGIGPRQLRGSSGLSLFRQALMPYLLRGCQMISWLSGERKGPCFSAFGDIINPFPEAAGNIELVVDDASHSTAST